MANLAATRWCVIDALNGIEGLKVRKIRPTVPMVGDGWVNIDRVEPGESFGTHTARFSAVVVVGVGTDEKFADAKLEELAVQAIDAVIEARLPAGELFAEPALIPTGEGIQAALYVLVLTLTLEVD